jgi:hypothetical protein
MSDDGADLNMPAEGAMKAIMGGEQPKRLSDEEFEQKIRTAEGTGSYDDTATYAARLVLEFLEAHPEHRDTPIEAEGAWRAPDGHFLTPEELRESLPEGAVYARVREGLYDVMKEAGVPIDGLDLTGFMWGWAANAGRHVLGLAHQPNPAIVEVNV